MACVTFTILYIGKLLLYEQIIWLMRESICCLDVVFCRKELNKEGRSWKSKHIICLCLMIQEWRRAKIYIAAFTRCEDSLELDLFLLQCCAVMAPPEEFVERLQARFSLSDFFTLVLWRPNEYGYPNQPCHFRAFKHIRTTFV